MEGKESALELLKDGVGMNFLQDGKKYRIFGSRCLLRNLGKVPAPFDSELSRTSRTSDKHCLPGLELTSRELSERKKQITNFFL